MSKNTQFTLSDIEQERLNDFKEKVKDLYDEYGTYSFTFTPSGIGNQVVVFSHLANLKKDITDTNW